ncbi:TRAP transporter small permease [Solibacillus sp. FSL K6-1523]|uniref:TRAP transporter small permease n=1 Tax=Solibacillus sp. FSL K6-1523 TaxID=2921471 RepID=UPI0030F6402E
MVQLLTKFSNLLTKLEEVIMTILMGALAILMIVAVCYRYFLKDPIPWAGEVSIFLLIWTSFIGGSWGLKYGTQASVTFLYDAISDNKKRWLRSAQDLTMIVFLGILIYYAVHWMMLPSMLIQKSSALQIPMWIPYSAVPIGLVFAFVHILTRFINNLVNGEPEVVEKVEGGVS